MAFTRRIYMTGRLLGLLLISSLLASPAQAREKEGMPDLAQVEQTCFPTAVANLMVWFSHNGYPNLLASGDDADGRNLHTIHLIMAASDARFDWGTRQETLTAGIQKFVRQAGYDADVEYRGLDYGLTPKPPQPLTEDWLYGNDDPNKGYILLFSYCTFHPDSNSYTDALGIGHAVTLVNAEPGLMLIHDPAHESTGIGRKIITPTILTSGSWQAGGISLPVSGLMLVSGTLLEAPDKSQVMLTGAICITMHPPAPPGAQAPPANPDSGPARSIDGTTPGATPGSTPSPPPAAEKRSWWMWIFDLLLKK